MKNTLIEKIPFEFKDCLPVSSYFVEGMKNEPFKNKSLKLVQSEFYNTQKMACYGIYKPAFLKNNNNNER